MSAKNSLPSRLIVKEVRHDMRYSGNKKEPKRNQAWFRKLLERLTALALRKILLQALDWLFKLLEYLFKKYFS
jgi:hypothetical protein